jgi:hypothetical protein
MMCPRMGIDALGRELKRGSTELLILSDGAGITSLTRTGRKTLASQRSIWEGFIDALNRVARIRHA